MNQIQKKKKKLHKESDSISLWERLKKFLAAKPKKEKPIRPKTFRMRKLGAVTFWLLFSFMFLVVLVTITSDTNSAQSNQGQAQVELNPATKPEAIQFAKGFARDYFTWKSDDEGWEDRQERLSRYLADGLDGQAGLVTEGLEWNSSVQGVHLRQVDEVTDRKAHIIFHVSMQMKKEKETEAISKYFAVPVVYNGSSYGVYELPFITHVVEETDVKIEENRYQTTLTSVKDNTEVENIESFLDTFFSSYVEDSEDQLSYILTDEEYQNGLHGALDFVEVNNAEVYEGKRDNQFIVITEATFKEPELNTAFRAVYKLVVEKKDGHYVVSKLNAEKQIEAISNE
ncbi:conjugal transfer protein [Virgibacillus xinjiangensis]|uniref:Conjugal transfer protein n=1 Tax=Virgibacillus xinjiangensis TaxID=393090 RepID=A0ABV7CYM6_9BACI